MTTLGALSFGMREPLMTYKKYMISENIYAYKSLEDISYRIDNETLIIERNGKYKIIYSFYTPEYVDLTVAFEPNDYQMSIINKLNALIKMTDVLDK